jgi:hypothetical protein
MTIKDLPTFELLGSKKKGQTKSAWPQVNLATHHTNSLQ